MNRNNWTAWVKIASRNGNSEQTKRFAPRYLISRPRTWSSEDEASSDSSASLAIARMASADFQIKYCPSLKMLLCTAHPSWWRVACPLSDDTPRCIRVCAPEGMASASIGDACTSIFVLADTSVGHQLINLFLDTLIQKIHFLRIKANNVRGDLSNISAKMATL